MIMEKKVYIMPSMKVVKINANRLLAGSDPQVYNQRSTEESYSREGRTFDDWE